MAIHKIFFERAGVLLMYDFKKISLIVKSNLWGIDNINTQRSHSPITHPNWLILLASIWLATLGNLPLWHELFHLKGVDGFSAVRFGFALAILITSLTFIILSLICWHWTLKIIITIFLIVAALSSYFMMTYGVVIDSAMLTNVMQTDWRESRDLTNWKMFLTVMSLGVLPSIWIWRKRIEHLSLPNQVANNLLVCIFGLLLSTLTVIPLYKDFASIMRSNTQLRYLINPLNSLYALSEIAIYPMQNHSSDFKILAQDVKLGSTYTNQLKVPFLILVVGETARSGNFGINGYAKDTTPALNLLEKNSDQTGLLSSFRNVWSCGTSTATSLPCMFSHLGKVAYEDRSENHENLVDVLQRAGLAVVWLENQSGCKGVCDRIPSYSTGNKTIKSYCDTGECFDEIMLHQLTERIASMPLNRTEKGIVVIMHQMGSHGPAYFKRTPIEFKKFQPECNSNTMQDCNRLQVVNAYDNTILYTDYFLSSVVKFLKEKEPYAQTAMLYLADHGESLGESNIYLHGLPYTIAPAVQKRVPLISWLSNDFLNRNKINTDCLNQKLNDKFSHNNYFHSVLGLMNLQTSVYKRSLDIFSSCETK